MTMIPLKVEPFLKTIERLRAEGLVELAPLQFTLKLYDQFTQQRLVMPCRGDKCTHSECFELAAYESWNAKRPLHPLCTICSAPTPPCSLHVDELMLRLLATTPVGMRSIVIIPAEAAYKVRVGHGHTTAAGGGGSTGVIQIKPHVEAETINLVSSDDEDDDVVALVSSDDEDDDVVALRPRKKHCTRGESTATGEDHDEDVLYVGGGTTDNQETTLLLRDLPAVVLKPVSISWHRRSLGTSSPSSRNGTIATGANAAGECPEDDPSVNVHELAAVLSAWGARDFSRVYGVGDKAVAQVVEKQSDGPFPAGSRSALRRHLLSIPYIGPRLAQRILDAAAAQIRRLRA